MNNRVKKLRLIKFGNGARFEAEDSLISEAPLTVKIGDSPFVTVMRTPGDELELAAGLLLSEGIIDSKKDLTYIRYCSEESKNVVETLLENGRAPVAKERMKAAMRLSRSSCGICGKEMMDDALSFTAPLEDDVKITAEKIIELANVPVKSDSLFNRTGAAHSATLFDAAGNVLSFAEDVGRHNALDKAIGRLVLKPPSVRPSTALLSSRGSYEMIQKVARARIPVVMFASAVTDAAVELADKLEVTVIGFLRDKRFNVYARADRIEFG